MQSAAPIPSCAIGEGLFMVDARLLPRKCEKAVAHFLILSMRSDCSSVNSSGVGSACRPLMGDCSSTRLSPPGSPSTSQASSIVSKHCSMQHRRTGLKTQLNKLRSVLLQHQGEKLHGILQPTPQPALLTGSLVNAFRITWSKHSKSS